MPINGAMYFRCNAQMLLQLVSRDAAAKRRSYRDGIDGVVGLDMLAAFGFPRSFHCAPFGVTP